MSRVSKEANATFFFNLPNKIASTTSSLGIRSNAVYPIGQEGESHPTAFIEELSSTVTNIASSFTHIYPINELQNLAGTFSTILPSSEALRGLMRLEWSLPTLHLFPATLNLTEQYLSTETTQTEGLTQLGNAYVLTLYTVRGEREEIINFLNDNPNLGVLLFEAFYEIRTYFHELPPTVELIPDPDFGDDQLLILIPTPLEVDKGMKLLYQFRDDWWLDNISRAGGKLLIDVDFE